MKLVTFLLLALVVPASLAGAQDKIIEETGIGPLRIGMTKAELDALGLEIEYGEVEEGDLDYCTYVSVKEPKLVGLMEKRVLGRIYFEDHDYVTREGIRVGDSEAKVRGTYGESLTEEPHAYVDGFYLFKLDSQGAGLLFEIDQGVVSGISAGVRPTIGYIEGCL